MTAVYEFADPVGRHSFNDDCVRVVPPQGRLSIMVWAGFTYNHKIALKVIEGNMNAVKYRDEILRDVI